MDTIRADKQYTGDIVFSGDVTLPANTVGNSQVTAGDPIAEEKIEHRHHCLYTKPGTAASETAVLFEAYAAGTVLAVECGSVGVAVGSATVTVDIKKNGTTILSSVVTLDSGNAAYTAEVGVVTVDTFADGDVLTAVIVATAAGGTIPTGLYVNLVVQEDNA